MQTRKGNATLIGLVVVLFAAFIVLTAAYQAGTMSSAQITVAEKYMYIDVSSSTDSEGDTSVSTTKNFVLIDTTGSTWKVGYPIWMPFRSAQMLYGRINVGETYKVMYWGQEIEWLGWFPVIYQAQGV